MLTLHSVLKHGGLYWDREVLPEPAYRERYARIQEEVARCGDDAWLLYGDVARYGCVTFATNFLPRVRSAVAYVPADGQPILLANIGKRDVPAARTITWVEDVRPFGRLPGELIRLIDDAGQAKGRIGLAGFDAIPVVDWIAVRDGLPRVDWEARDIEMMSLRAAKEDWEIAAMSRAAKIADDGLALVPEIVRPGATVREIFARVDRSMRAAGAEDARYLIASGAQSGMGLRPMDDRQLVPGDVLLVYAAVEAQRYWAETARTVVLGAAPDAVRNLHDQALRSVAAMREGVQAGAMPGAIAAAGSAAVESSAARIGAAAYGWGNGIGLDAEEPPAIAEEERGSALAGNATLGLRAILHENGLGAAVAQTVAVRSHGVQALNEAAPLVEVHR